MEVPAHPIPCRLHDVSGGLTRYNPFIFIEYDVHGLMLRVGLAAHDDIDALAMLYVHGRLLHRPVVRLPPLSRRRLQCVIYAGDRLDPRVQRETLVEMSHDGCRCSVRILIVLCLTFVEVAEDEALREDDLLLRVFPG